MPVSDAYRPAPVYEAIAEGLADPVEPAAFPDARLRYWNGRWAAEVGLSGLSDSERQAHFWAFDALPDNQRRPLAMRYHGHQFRSYNPQLGDGRGFLHAQLRDGAGRLLDLATKGSGQTPYSRTADGRLTLKGAVREIFAADMLEALGVYTSKAFCVYETGEDLTRHDEPSPARSAVLTRLGHSHIRFGSFQYHAWHQDKASMHGLLDHAVANYCPELIDESDLPAAFLSAVAGRVADTAARWMAAGFVHGVLNTDNINITGESFDYGPWRFLPHYEPGFTAAYFDETGLYAYARQPEAVFWALQQLAGALSLIGDRLSLEAALNTFPALYRLALPHAFLARLGLQSRGRVADEAWLKAFLSFMQVSSCGWDDTIFDWFGGAASRDRAVNGPRAVLYAGQPFDDWHVLMMQHDPERPERLGHAAFAQDHPQHMTIDVVEECWKPIAESDDWSRFDSVLAGITELRCGYDLGQGRDGFLCDD